MVPGAPENGEEATASGVGDSVAGMRPRQWLVVPGVLMIALGVVAAIGAVVDDEGSGWPGVGLGALVALAGYGVARWSAD